MVRKAEGDVLGNAVNIASRLESSAPHGSILISDKVQEKVKDSVHSREIGHITVKNISEPIRVFEPYEIVLDLPAELDPLKAGAARTGPDAGGAPRGAAPGGAPVSTAAGGGASATPGGAAPGAAPAPRASAPNSITLDVESWTEIVKCFSALAAACRGAADGQIPVATVNAQILSRWDRVKGRLSAGAAAPKRPAGEDK